MISYQCKDKADAGLGIEASTDSGSGRWLLRSNPESIVAPVVGKDLLSDLIVPFSSQFGPPINVYLYFSN